MNFTETANNSLDRALADVEMLQAAYPDEVVIVSDGTQVLREFPILVEFCLEVNASITLEFVDGYPTRTGVQISSYRSSNKEKIDALARAVRLAAEECLAEEMEGGLTCCAAAMQIWNDFETRQNLNKKHNGTSSCSMENHMIESIPHTKLSSLSGQQQPLYEWVTGEPLIDRKSVFVAHACQVSTEEEVKAALSQLLSSTSKIQRATHNMYAWRLTEKVTSSTTGDGTNQRILNVLKHDNDDDGEDGAGSRMALLLHQRNEDRVIVVVSRWFGGIHLGPKRFAHIVNVTRDLLIHCHENVWNVRKR